MQEKKGFATESQRHRARNKKEVLKEDGVAGGGRAGAELPLDWIAGG